MQFSRFQRGFGCTVSDAGRARIVCWVEGASVNREATVAELRRHALTCLAAAEVAEGIAEGEAPPGLPTEGAE